jgi:hypothetical protein
MSARLDPARLAAACAGLPALDEAALGARILAALPTHESRPAGLLREWAGLASRFGVELADGAGVSDADGLAAQAGLPVIQEADGGLARTHLTLAQYGTRPPSVRIFRDAIAVAEDVVGTLGWGAWFPPGSVRDVAVCHEVAHHLLHGTAAAALKRRLGHVLLKMGPVTVRGHVVGADEIAAHSFAQGVCRLPRSPLLITLALQEASAVADLAAGPLAGSGKPLAGSGKEV